MALHSVLFCSVRLSIGQGIYVKYCVSTETQNLVTSCKMAWWWCRHKRRDCKPSKAKRQRRALAVCHVFPLSVPSSVTSCTVTSLTTSPLAGSRSSVRNRKRRQQRITPILLLLLLLLLLLQIVAKNVVIADPRVYATEQVSSLQTVCNR